MRQTILGALAALAAVTASAVPALACGYGTCSPCATPCAQSYAPALSYAPAYSYAPTYSGCATGCNSGWAFEHLAEPATQYYYVNQGPTYSGPGAFAPVPTYEDSAVSTQPYYGYQASARYDDGAGVAGPAVYGYRWHHRHPYHWGAARYYHHRPRYGYMPYYHGHRVLRRYY
jgi:hypothetical protein